MKILFCSSEVVPFAKTGGLADVAGALPLALEKLGEEASVVLPKYKSLDKAKCKIQNLKAGISSTRIGKNIPVYFVENESFFHREGLYGDKNGDYPDNLERFSFFCKKTLELLKTINLKPDIIHCNDWQSSLIPVYLKNLYKDDPFYSSTKTILTIHNLAYQGLFPKEEFPKLGLDWDVFNLEGLEFYGKVNLLKGGILFSDIVNTVSPTYAKEIQTKQFGCGLEGVLSKRRDSLFGILNGLDYSLWDAAIDGDIIKNYSSETIEDKYVNKKHLQSICGLARKKDIPLFGMVGRLAEQKGLDLLAEAMNQICSMALQLVILGTGELKYHLLLKKQAKKFKKVISLHLKFDNPLAHKIYAGCDIFLMPSRYEPCGLGQMISLKYGTIPLVFKSGGLADTVENFNPSTGEGNGFVFYPYEEDKLVKAIKDALLVYKDKAVWRKLMIKAMRHNFSWEEAAKKYIELYRRLV